MLACNPSARRRSRTSGVRPTDWRMVSCMIGWLLTGGARPSLRVIEGRAPPVKSQPIMQETILQSVGRTPLVRLRRLAEGLQASIYVKVESLNPGGSVKDRVAV